MPASGISASWWITWDGVRGWGYRVWRSCLWFCRRPGMVLCNWSGWWGFMSVLIKSICCSRVTEVLCVQVDGRRAVLPLVVFVIFSLSSESLSNNLTKGGESLSSRVALCKQLCVVGDDCSRSSRVIVCCCEVTESGCWAMWNLIVPSVRLDRVVTNLTFCLLLPVRGQSGLIFLCALGAVCGRADHLF